MYFHSEKDRALLYPDSYKDIPREELEAETKAINEKLDATVGQPTSLAYKLFSLLVLAGLWFLQMNLFQQAPDYAQNVLPLTICASLINAVLFFKTRHHEFSFQYNVWGLLCLVPLSGALLYSVESLQLSYPVAADFAYPNVWYFFSYISSKAWNASWELNPFTYDIIFLYTSISLMLLYAFNNPALLLVRAERHPDGLDANLSRIFLYLLKTRIFVPIIVLELIFGAYKNEIEQDSTFLFLATGFSQFIVGYVAYGFSFMLVLFKNIYNRKAWKKVFFPDYSDAYAGGTGKVYRIFACLALCCIAYKQINFFQIGFQLGLFYLPLAIAFFTSTSMLFKRRGNVLFHWRVPRVRKREMYDFFFWPFYAFSLWGMISFCNPQYSSYCAVPLIVGWMRSESKFYLLGGPFWESYGPQLNALFVYVVGLMLFTFSVDLYWGGHWKSGPYVSVLAQCLQTSILFAVIFSCNHIKATIRFLQRTGKKYPVKIYPARIRAVYWFAFVMGIGLVLYLTGKLTDGSFLYVSALVLSWFFALVILISGAANLLAGLKKQFKV